MGVYIKLPTGLAFEMIDPAMPAESLVGLNQWLLAALSQEPTTGVPGPVTRDIRYARGELSMTRDEVIASLTANPIGPGDPNPLFRILDAIDKQKETDPNSPVATSYGETWSDMATIGPVVRDEWKRTGYLYALVMSGGTVTGLQMFFVVPVDAYQDAVPEIMPNSQVDTGEVDEQGEPVFRQKTWAECSAVSAKGPWGGDYYVPDSASNNQQSIDNVALAIQIATTAGVGVVSSVDYVEIAAANQPSEPI